MPAGSGRDTGWVGHPDGRPEIKRNPARGEKGELGDGEEKLKEREEQILCRIMLKGQVYFQVKAWLHVLILPPMLLNVCEIWAWFSTVLSICFLFVKILANYF